MSEDARPPEFVQSLERGLAVIRAFTEDQPSLTLSDVARATALSRAAARRFLLTLQHLEYVTTDGNRFSLTPRVLELGYAYLSSKSVAGVAETHLEKLSKELGESSSASVLDGDSIVYIARAAADRIMTIQLAVGRRLPAHATSMGRVLLAALPEEDLDAYLTRYPRQQLTPRTVTDAEELKEVLAGVRKHGWALIDQELEGGVRSVAAPVHDARGAVVAAVNVSAHSSRVSLSDLKNTFLPALLRTAEAIDRDLRTRR